MLQVHNVSKYIEYGLVRKRKKAIVNNTSFSIQAGETFGLIGESGSGKTTLSRMAIGLLRPDEGAVEFAGYDLYSASRGDSKLLRQKMQMIFQHPDTACNPRKTLLQSIMEPFVLHPTLRKGDDHEQIEEVMNMVGLQPELLRRYPYQVSGGQIQRIVLARALLMNPEFIVLDEPTLMLDVSVQAQILRLLKHIQKQRKMTYLFISHDLDVVNWMSDRVAVMKDGEIVETGTSNKIMKHPTHPYTQKLVQAFLYTDR